MKASKNDSWFPQNKIKAFLICKRQEIGNAEPRANLYLKPSSTDKTTSKIRS